MSLLKISFYKISADKLLPIGVELQEESPYTTLEEAASMAAQSSHSNVTETATSMDYEMDDAMPSTSHASHSADGSTATINPKDIKQFIGHTIPKDFLMKSGLLNSSNGESDSAEPLYKVRRDGSVIGLVHSQIFKFQCFHHFHSLQIHRRKFMTR